MHCINVIKPLGKIFEAYPHEKQKSKKKKKKIKTCFHICLLRNAALTRLALRLLPLRNPTTGILGNTFFCSLSGAYDKWSSCNMFLMF